MIHNYIIRTIVLDCIELNTMVKYRHWRNNIDVCHNTL
nr:MAG TPA: hypothetical protein [Bacteriophage sp.]